MQTEDLCRPKTCADRPRRQAPYENFHRNNKKPLVSQVSAVRIFFGLSHVVSKIRQDRFCGLSYVVYFLSYKLHDCLTNNLAPPAVNNGIKK